MQVEEYSFGKGYGHIFHKLFAQNFDKIISYIPSVVRMRVRHSSPWLHRENEKNTVIAHSVI